MNFYKKLVPTLVIFLLVVVTSTYGAQDEVHDQSIQQSVVTNNTRVVETGTNSTTGNSSDHFDWSSNEDYTNFGDEDKGETNADFIEPSKPENVTFPANHNETKTSTLPSVSASLNGTTLENKVLVSSPPESGTSSTSESASSLPKEEEASSDDSASKSTDDDDVPPSTSTTENQDITSSSERLPSSAIITQDAGDVSNYTSTPVSNVGSDTGSTGLRTWAVVVVSVLISFAVIFTILFVIRRELIRRRKADQRRLLRGSVSSEGYFYGDGEGNTGGKFEL